MNTFIKKGGLFGLLAAGYVGIRHVIPPQEIICDYKNDRELLTVNKHNLLFFTRVETWYDCDGWCGPISNYYWRHVKLLKIKRDGTMEVEE
jgi:hypothetical protein